jgi:phosphohistidine phosphatase SixA
MVVFTISRRNFATVVLAFGLVVVLSAVPTAADDKAIAIALRTGGLIIVVRHGSTFRDQADTDPLHPDNIAAQRQLNDAGKAAARAFGEAFRQIGVPVGDVYTSQLNRAYETAVLAGFKNIVKSADVTEGGLVVSPNENDRRTTVFRKLLTVVPKPGTDTVIITHKPNIVDALGKDWFDLKEGEASILKPEGSGYKLIARIQMDEWPRIAAAK